MTRADITFHIPGVWFQRSAARAGAVYAGTKRSPRSGAIRVRGATPPPAFATDAVAIDAALIT